MWSSLAPYPILQDVPHCDVSVDTDIACYAFRECNQPADGLARMAGNFVFQFASHLPLQISTLGYSAPNVQVKHGHVCPYSSEWIILCINTTIF